MRKIFLVAFLAVILPSAAQHTYYISISTGADTNTSTQAQSKSTPWAHVPGMVTCTSACASYTPVAGDQFILRGNDSWPNANFPIMWSWSGSSASAIYVGVDKSWYSGSSWNRPIFNAGGAAIAGTYNMFLRFSGAVTYVTLDNLEMTGMYWIGNPAYGTLNYINAESADSITFENLYAHDWTHAATGATDDLVVIQGSTTSPFCQHCTLENSVIENADGGGDSGEATYAFGGNIQNNVCHDLPNCFLLEAQGDVSGNLIYNITTSFSGTHENAIETINQNGTYYIHDNVIHDITAESLFIGGEAYTTYIFNNLFYNLASSNPPSLEGRKANYPAYFFSNTVVTDSGDGCFEQVGTTATLTVTLADNHCITTGSLTNGSGYTLTSNLAQTPTVATGQGFTATQAFVYFPTAGASTIDAGTNLTSSWPSGYVTQDTAYACTEQTVSGIVQSVCPARSSHARPSSGAWDIGAYEYSAAASVGRSVLTALSF